MLARADDVVLEACDHALCGLTIQPFVWREGIWMDGVVGEGVELRVEAVDVALEAGKVDGAAVGGAEGNAGRRSAEGREGERGRYIS